MIKPRVQKDHVSVRVPIIAAAAVCLGLFPFLIDAAASNAEYGQAPSPLQREEPIEQAVALTAAVQEEAAPGPAEGEYGNVTEEELKEPGAVAPGKSADQYGNVTEEETGEEKVEETAIRDPLERVNRAMFTFNDRLYFWVFKPVTKGYKRVVSEDFRVVFNNFYKNLFSPIRLVNNLLQLRFSEAGAVFTRLVVNSTVGVGGLRDIGGDCFGIRDYDADFGQTLGFYGIGQGFYVVWPVLGPSTARDSVGLGGDFLLNPLTWAWTYPALGLGIHNRINVLSFRLGDYEALKKAAIDPYVSVRNAYYQNRRAAVLGARVAPSTSTGVAHGATPAQ